MNQALRPFDVGALYSALDGRRTTLGISWQTVAKQLTSLPADS